MPTTPKSTAPKSTTPNSTTQKSTAPSDEPEDLAEELSHLSYEQAREELIQVVQQLESGGAPLAESLALWERGERLATVCQEWLDGAKARIETAAAKRSSAADQEVVSD